MIDLRLNAIVDPERANGRSLVELTRLVVAGGATLIQLRDKHGSTRRMIEEARAIKGVLAGTGVPLVINDRVDVALAAGGGGVCDRRAADTPRRAREAARGRAGRWGRSVGNHHRRPGGPARGPNDHGGGGGGGGGSGGGGGGEGVGTGEEVDDLLLVL